MKKTFVIKKIYPYLVLVACCGLVITTFGFFNSQGLYFESIEKDLDIDKGSVSLYVTIIYLVSAIAAVSWARNIRSKYNTKLVIGITGLITLTSYLLFPYFTSKYQIYLFAVVVGISAALIGNTFVVEVLNEWFEKAGTAIGLTMAMSGLFGIFYSPIASNLILKYGWRKAYFSFAFIYAIVIVVALIIIKSNKKEVVERKKDRTLFNKKLLLLATYYVAGSATTYLVQFIPSFGTDYGFSPQKAAVLVSAVSAGNLLMKIVFGYIGDHFGGLKSAIVNYLMTTVGLVMLIVLKGNSYLFLMVACFLIGSTFATVNVVSQGLCNDMFGKAELGKYYATLGLFSSVSAFSATAIGSVYDAFGSYDYAVAFLIMLLTIGMVLIIIDFKLFKKDN